MTTRIRRIEVTDQTLVPAGAEVWVAVHLDQVTPTTEVRGRLKGPTCLYSSTVEVAYPLQPLAKNQKPPASERPAVTMRVIIPEPSLWDPVSPFLYHGPVELWVDGERLEQVAVRHGLRIQTLSPRGLRWNGRPLLLRGKELQSYSEEEMLASHAAGYNLLTAPVGAETLPLWERADRIGFLMLGRVAALDEPLAADVAAHPCCLGFVVDVAVWAGARRDQREGFKSRTRAFVGVELDAPPAQPLPAGFDFAVCASEKCEKLCGVGLPLLSWE